MMSRPARARGLKQYDFEKAKKAIILRGSKAQGR
jgi:hypothetical protein